MKVAKNLSNLKMQIGVTKKIKEATRKDILDQIKSQIHANFEKLFPFNQESEELADKMNLADDDMVSLKLSIST